MYGLIGSFSAHPGKRDELAALMTQSVGNMPGCLSYIVARDPKDADKLWITEVWDSATSHKASLQIPEVAATIKQAMPLIAGFGDHIETEPVGGYGI
ncbi:MAG: putative quinol monooxygenase [Devosia sp.]